MGVRSALRVVQDNEPAVGPGVVVSAVQPPGGQPAGAPATPASPLTEFLERLTAWIPTESIALFLSFGGFFDVYDDTTKEIGLVVAVGLLTLGYAAGASRAAQRRRNQPHNSAASAKTAGIALASFLVWWAATPGTWLTADEGVDSYWVALVLVVVVAVLPWIAKQLRIEPIRSQT